MTLRAPCFALPLLAFLAAFALPLLTLTCSLGSDEASSVWFSQGARGRPAAAPVRPASARLLPSCCAPAWQVGGDPPSSGCVSPACSPAS